MPLEPLVLSPGEKLRFIQPYVGVRFMDQVKAVVPLALYLALFKLLILSQLQENSWMIMGAMVAVHLVTLPAELDASFGRAMPMLETGYLEDEDLPAARSVLRAAAWTYVAGADWRHPLGPGSNIDGLDDHPVVLVSWHDATAYAQWAGLRLPTEFEIQAAGRGEKDQPYPWGEEWVQENAVASAGRHGRGAGTPDARTRPAQAANESWKPTVRGHPGSTRARPGTA